MSFESGPSNKSERSDEAANAGRKGEAAENRPTDSPAEAKSPSNEREPLELRDSDFATPSSVTERAAPPVPSIQPPGPGLGEAVSWTFGVFVVHLLAGIATLIVIVVGQVFTQGGMAELQRVASSPERLKEFFERHLVVITCGEMAVFVLAALAATRLRLGRQTVRLLNFSSIPAVHLALIAAVVLPLSLVSGQLHWWSTQVLEQFAELFPSLSGLFQNVDVNDIVSSMARETSLPLLILMIAVAPAVGEEVVFRGIIGRGLMARWGLVSGIAVTSVLFAIAHGQLAHAFALLPLAVFIHLVYFVTRSFWAPVLMHFLNNAWAVTVAKYADTLNVEGLADEEPVPVLVVAASSLCIAALGICLWRTRVTYRLDDGAEWAPGYSTVEAPPAGVEARRWHHSFDARCWVLATVGLMAFVGSLLISALLQ